MGIRPLPAAAAQLLARVGAPPRLVAHLTLVHDAAFDLVQAFQTRWPDLPIDSAAVLFGAATHDIGKALHPAELVGPGKQHEVDGPGVLERFDVPAAWARFARTHGSWKDEPNLTIEDYLIALADHCWKGARSEDLEAKIAGLVARRLGLEAWETYLALDEIVTVIARNGDERLAWQSRTPTP